MSVPIDDSQNPYRAPPEPRSESGAAPVPGVSLAPADPQAAAREASLTARMRSGAGWFYWIVGLSIVNSLLFALGAGFVFIVGLGITQILDGLAQGMRQNVGNGAALTLVHLVLYACAVAPFLLLGLFARRGHTWAFVLGMLVYMFDGLLLIPFQDWMGVGFHALVLYWIWHGFQACRQLHASRAATTVPALDNLSP
jgi:hypothetical protein